MRAFARSSRRYFIASMALALAAGLLLHSYLAQAARAAAAAGPQVQVVVASQPIPRGETVNSTLLRLRRMPAVYAPPGSLSHIEQAAGRVALSDLSAGEAVTDPRLARVRAGPVASLVPEGLRAFAVPTTLPPGALAPGDHVDVLATYSSGQPHTETVVAGVEVLSLLGPARSAGGKPAAGGIGFDAAAGGSAQGVTLILLVAPDQQDRLAYARAFAYLEVTIAPPDGD